MKINILKNVQTLAWVSSISVFIFSCQKNNPLIDANYTDQYIYMAQSAAATLAPNTNGVYNIIANIEGQAKRFSVDASGNKFNIPLGIIKSGVSTKGNYIISINANADTINKLIVAKKFAVITDTTLTTELLPATAYALPASVTINDDSTSATFPLSLDLNFLKNSFAATPKKRYAVAVAISYSAKSTLIKTALATTIIFIDPSLVFTPVSNFSTYIYPVTKTVNIFNLSANAVSYAWTFGDNSAVSTDAFPSHVYAASGTYTVTLTTTGVAGSGAPSVKTTNVVIP